MSDVTIEQPELPRRRGEPIRSWLSRTLGVGVERKEGIYIDIYRSTSLGDTTYWMEILFSCGIATLGLVLNSPAVIIGAMLISPLMGPILGGGLSLATGDLILGARAVVNLFLSCMAAVAFSAILVAILPFKEMTPEIAARTSPNTLDLVIALFSGAVGAIAICKPLKGVATSLPGVAIAVALMPPLCVTGYGLGLALTFNPADGLEVVRGGGLLFLTNLIAITAMSMVVFLALDLNIPQVTEAVREWRRKDSEVQWFQQLLEPLPRSERLRAIGGLPGRTILIILFMVTVSIPLTQSFNRLRDELATRQRENRVQRVATQIWQDSYAANLEGEPRSYVDSLSIAEREGTIVLNLRIFTSEPYSEREQQAFARRVAASLGRANEQVVIHLIEIPTTTAQIALQRREIDKPAPPPPTIQQLESGFTSAMTTALTGLPLPASATLLRWEAIASSDGPSKLLLHYLAAAPLSDDAVELLVADARRRTTRPDLDVLMHHVPSRVTIDRNARGEVDDEADAEIARLRGVLHAYPRLYAEVTMPERPGRMRGPSNDDLVARLAAALPGSDRVVIRRTTEQGAPSLDVTLRRR